MAKKCDEIVKVPVCRNKNGTFASHGRSVTKKSKASKPRRKMAKGAQCAPKTMYRDAKGNCHCSTRGGGSKFVPRSRCKGVRRRSPKKR